MITQNKDHLDKEKAPREAELFLCAWILLLIHGFNTKNKKRAAVLAALRTLVREEGLEPSRRCQH